MYFLQFFVHKFTLSEAFLLTVCSLLRTDATEQLVATLSLQPLEGTDVVLNNTTHALKLYGKTVSGGRVAALVRMAYSAKSGVTTKVTVRAEEEGVAATVVASVA